jgi:hypothetical protein
MVLLAARDKKGDPKLGGIERTYQIAPVPSQLKRIEKRSNPPGARHASGIARSLWGRMASCGGLVTRLFVVWACASVGSAEEREGRVPRLS